jgi:hypothetical protein
MHSKTLQGKRRKKLVKLFLFPKTTNSQLQRWTVCSSDTMAKESIGLRVLFYFRWRKLVPVVSLLQTYLQK